MRVLTLKRFALEPDGTLGRIVDEKGRRVCETLELAWLGNQRSKSCIPAGTYTARRRFSPKHNADVFQLEGVPGRDNIELHVGNYVSGVQVDSEGCILLGLGHTTQDNGAPMLTASKTGFSLFMKLMKDEESFTLAVIDPEPIAA